jgi:hypothetical protein
LVNNVETIANVPDIVAHGAEWFRSTGTPESPGTVVCTLTRDVNRHRVGEVAMGTPLWHVIESISGGPIAPVEAVPALVRRAAPRPRVTFVSPEPVEPACAARPRRTGQRNRPATARPVAPIAGSGCISMC